jgi:RNA polymerase sigma-70 factor (ECF subfamily)
VKALSSQPKEVSNMDEMHIVNLYFARDERAIKETQAKFGRLCHTISYNILHNHQDAEECVNDTYVGIWNAIPPANPDDLTAFVCRIARNISLKKLEHSNRKKRASVTLVSLDELAEILPDESIGDGMETEEIGKHISNFLRGEKEDVRNVFIRKYYFFDSIEDIARQYGFTQSKVKNMLYHTRNKLKEYLIKEGIEL